MRIIKAEESKHQLLDKPIKKTKFPIFQKYYYLAYGSNLNLDQMKYRCPFSKMLDKCFLENYRLVYKGEGDNYAYLTIEEHEGSLVPVGLYEINILDLLSLDMYEGYPSSYGKNYVPIEYNDKDKAALIYVMNKRFNYHMPADQYVKRCKDGYDNFEFDPDILNKAYTDTQDVIERIRKK